MSLVSELSKMLGTMADAESYNQLPPIGPPTDRPRLSNEELELAKRVSHGPVLGNDYAFPRLN